MGEAQVVVVILMNFTFPVLWHWLGLGTTPTWPGLGKDHILGQNTNI